MAIIIIIVALIHVVHLIYTTLFVLLFFVVVCKQLDSFFCVGSPLAVFLVMRGFRAQGTGSISQIIPKSICKQIFNIYHPADPVVSQIVFSYWKERDK